jgi:hypothetical protein
MGTEQQGPDPVLDADRDRKAPPESGPQSENVVGRPAVERPRTAFHEPAETADEEREPVTPAEALKEGGSFDGVAPLQDL